MYRLCKVLAVLVVCSSAAAQEDRPDVAPTREEREAAAGLQQTLRAYQQAFNAADAQAVADFWAPHGVYVDRVTGQRTTGRQAIREEMVELFRAHPERRLMIRLERIRMIHPDVVRAEGSTELLTQGTVHAGGFTALFVRHDGRWYIDHAEEHDLQPSRHARTTLRELDWMVGRWVDQLDDARVESDVRWAPGESFLIRSYTIETGETTDRGTQIIGWDPVRRQIRSWTFDADGAFGEGLWSRSGQEWLVRMTFTTRAGDVVSGTQVITPMGDRAKVQTIGLEMNGEPQPSREPVFMVCVTDRPTTRPAEHLQGVQR
ncbi:MAG TPA: SgcJ/EcaC family oxidoreductase [Phycisphaerae bacterium]|nr:SgcJ/EcaC family oxidoreductase [Phycisphaerae bacterium]HOJ73761.1 SgcJ/EcaC family oxidoreductase [Phycisphaerae bacterium]HOM50408.1 SgcJ/EcaC family oxidoreductase [Phycisphaerae bacterium]HON65694.1 SgcJ/EcaC family oxidoreductase [Phycisphaerae bacterium]HPP27317.1 SgcJ/EcaC family oxidoreductase [Phycisphaerae bacterium]